MSKTIVVRVHEWTEWIGDNKDDKSPLVMSQGQTSFQAEDHEKVLEIAVTATGQTKFFPVKADSVLEPANRKFGLYAFQAVLVHEAAEGESLPDSVGTEEPKSKLHLLGGK